MTGGVGSFVVFRRFRKRKILLGVLVCGGVIAAFHTRIGCVISNEIRFFLGSTRVALGNYCDNIERVFLNFFYFLSCDIEGKMLDLYHSNEQLREEIEKIRHLQQENEELKKLLSLKESVQGSPKVAKVVDIFSNDFTQSIILDVGEIDGIAVGDVVKNFDGLIGRVTEVNDTWSRVLLITDMNSSIPVKIGETPVNAIMTGGNSNDLFISTIHEDIPINDGDEVRTSGYGICEDIYVGTIVKTEKKNRVKSHVAFNSLRYVIVEKNSNANANHH
jgi:rod shape-determining protein MreC